MWRRKKDCRKAVLSLNERFNLDIGMNRKIYIAMRRLDGGSGQPVFVDVNDRPTQAVGKPHFVKQIGVDYILQEGHNTACVIFVQPFTFKQGDGFKGT